MKNDDKKSFAEALGLAAIVYSKDITREHLEAYWGFLTDYDIADIKSAINQHVKSSKFFPTPADIIENIPKKPATTWVREEDGFRYRTLPDGTKRRLLS